MVLLPLEAEPVLVVRFAFPSVCGLSDSSMTLGLRRCRSKDSLAGPLPDLPQTVALSRAEMLPALQFLNVGRLSGDFRCFALHYYAGQACAVPTKTTVSVDIPEKPAPDFTGHHHFSLHVGDLSSRVLRWRNRFDRCPAIDPHPMLKLGGAPDTDTRRDVLPSEVPVERLNPLSPRCTTDQGPKVPVSKRIHAQK